MSEITLDGASAIERVRQPPDMMEGYRAISLAMQAIAGPSKQSFPVKDLRPPQIGILDRSVGVMDEEYAALAVSLGIVSTATLEAKLEDVLARLAQPTYNYAEVADYLDNECNKKKQETVDADPNIRIGWHKTFEWSWKPVRKRDRCQGESAPRASNMVYAQAIPYPVLTTMQGIAEQMPEAKFFVSEINEVPDPFLAVTVAGSRRMWVLERWDEPGFREAQK